MDEVKWEVTDNLNSKRLLLKLRNDHLHVIDKEVSSELKYPINEIIVDETQEGPLMQRKRVFISSALFTTMDIDFETAEDSDDFYLVVISKIAASRTPDRTAEEGKGSLTNFSRFFSGIKAGFHHSITPKKEKLPLLAHEVSLSIEDITKNIGRKIFTMPDNSPYSLFALNSGCNDYSASKGELGCTPELASTYEICLHKNHVPSFPVDATPDVVSSKWTDICHDMWKWFIDTQCSQIEENGVFDFSWRAFTEGALHSSSSFTSHIPIHFELNKKSVWEMYVGKKTAGTCYRRCADKLSQEDAWLSNSISNFYKITNHIKDKSESRRVAANIYRHGIVGFQMKTLLQANYLIPQITLVLIDALECQKKLSLPFRIVSHNLVNQTKMLGTLNNERHMIDRQGTAFAIALNMATQKGMCDHGESPSLLEFFLPCNTDQSVLYALEDSIDGLNDPASLQYLLWVAEDCCDVFSNIVLPENEYSAYKRKNAPRNDARWKNQSPRYLVKNISLINLFHDISFQMPSDVEYIASFVCLSQVKEFGSYLSFLLAEITLRLMRMKDGELDGEDLHLFSRTIMAILSGLGFAIYRELQKEDIIASADPLIYKYVIEDLQRCRISVNLLRASLHSEVFKRSEFEGKKEWEGVRGMGRIFTRITSLLCIALLDYSLGACIFVNCKSGLDRTGLFVALQNAIISLWEQYPTSRWKLHLTCINYNRIRKVDKMRQPTTKEKDVIRQMLQDLNSTSHSELEGLIEDNFGKAPEEIHIEFGVTKIVFDRSTLRTFAMPMFYLIKNFCFSYLLDVNTLITYASTGLRGMKYHNHVLVGLLMPDAIILGDEKHSLVKKAASLSGGLVAAFLTELGESLLVDLAAHRKS